MADPKVVRESRPVAGFSRVTLAGTGTLRISQGERESLTVESTTEMLEKTTSEVRDGELTLGLKRGAWLSGVRDKSSTIIFELTMKEVNCISLSGVGGIEAGPVRTGKLSLVVSGSGTLVVHGLSADGLDVTLSGAGSCEVDGKTTSQDVIVSGAGDYRAGGLESATAKVSISGAGNAEVRVADTIDAVVSGAGNVTCCGEPTVFRRVTGVGRITCVREDEAGPRACGSEGGER